MSNVRPIRTPPVEPTTADYDTAFRLSGIHFYDGHEPYAPSVASFARLVCAHRLELEAGHAAERQRLLDKIVQLTAALMDANRSQAEALEAIAECRREIASDRAVLEALRAKVERLR